MKYLLDILRRLLRRKAPSEPSMPAYRTVTAREVDDSTLYFVRTSKGIVVLY
jgi:hypothetical protein